MKTSHFLPSLLLLSFSMLAPNETIAQTGSWVELEVKGEAQERHENALVRAGNKFILLGGRGLKAVDIYDTQTKEWTPGAQPPFEIHHVQAVSQDGLVYVLGAFTGSYPYETPLSHILIYDPLLDTWAIGPEIPDERRRGAAGVVAHNGKIYMVNGIINGHTSGWVPWLDEFDPATNQWKILPDAPRSRDHVHAAVIDNKLYVAGGRRSGFASKTFDGTVKETSIYDFNTGKWSELASPEGDIPTQRAGAAVAVLDGNLLMIGGESGSQELAHNEVEMLDMNTGSWKTLEPLQRGRHGTQAISYDDKVVIGAGSGNRGGGPELNSFEILALDEDTEFAADPITKGEIAGSVAKLAFKKSEKGKKKTIELENRGGNQAILLNYMLLDNTGNFVLQMPVESPYVLGPGQKLPVEMLYKGSSSEPAEVKLLVKTLGNSAPLSIPVIVEK